MTPKAPNPQRRLKQSGLAAILLAASVAGLVSLVALSRNTSLFAKQQISENAYDTAKAQLNAQEGMNQLVAYFNTLDQGRLSVVQQAFPNSSPSLCNGSSTPPGSEKPLSFKPILEADRKDDNIVINAVLGNGSNPCQPPSPENWKLYFKITGTYKCTTNGDPLCAKREIQGNLTPNTSMTSAQVCVPGKTICRNVDTVTSYGSDQVNYRECGQMDAYEFKPLNMRTVGGFTTNQLYGGGVAANPNTIRNFSAIWKAPLTVTGNIVNATDTSKMYAEGFKTRISVSFAENALYMGTSNMPPMTYFQPVEIGGKVTPRPHAYDPFKLNVPETRDIELNTFGASLSGSGKLSDNPAGPVNVRASYSDNNPDLLDNSRIAPDQVLPLKSLSSLNDNPNLRNLTNADDLLTYFLGVNYNKLSEVSNAGIDTSLTSMLPIEDAQKSAQKIFGSGPVTNDETDWRKVGVVYYLVNVNNQPTRQFSYKDENGNTVNLNRVVYDLGSGYYDGVPGVDNRPYCDDIYNAASIDFKVATGSCIEPLEIIDPASHSNLVSNLQTYNNNVNQANQRMNEAQNVLNQRNYQEQQYNSAVYRAQDSQAHPERYQGVVYPIPDPLPPFDPTPYQNKINQAQIDRANAETTWTQFIEAPKGYRQKYAKALDNVTYLQHKTYDLMVTRPTATNYQEYQSTGSHWLRDYWNNPVSNKGTSGCFGNNLTPCLSPYSGAQSMTDNAVVVIDARNTDGVYWKYLRYPAAQLIIVLGNLIVEDVNLNANLVVMGNLIVKNRGLALAPRRWWGVPRYKICTSTLTPGSAAFPGGQRFSEPLTMGGDFYLFNGAAAKVHNCTWASRGGGQSIQTTQVCDTFPSSCKALIESSGSLAKVVIKQQFFDR